MVSVRGERGLVLVAAIAAASGCASGRTVRPEPRRPLALLLQRGALASAAVTLDTPRTERQEAADALPDALRPGAARRYAERALPVAPRGGVALARLGPGGRLVETAVGDFSAPLVVVDDPGPGAAPEVLLEGGNVRLLARLPRRMLREVTTGGAILTAGPGESGAEVSLRLGPGLPLERLGRVARQGQRAELLWVRYRDPEVEVVGVIEPERVGRIYRPAPRGELTAGDAEVQTPLFLFDRPGGRPFATVWRPAGPLIPVLRVRAALGHTLVRMDASRDLTVTGWVRTLDVEVAATNVRERPRDRAPGQWLSVADLRGRDVRCLELARSTRLRQRPGGPVAGLVTRDDRFVLLGDRRPGWLEVGVGHPFGLARLWVPAHRARKVRCARADLEPGATM